MLGKEEEAEGIFKKLLLGHPLSQEAQIARAKLTAMGAETSLTTDELRSLGDAYYNAGRYDDAGEAISRAGSDVELAATRAATDLRVAAAACDLKLKRLSKTEAEDAARYERREWRAAALSADGTGKESQRHSTTRSA